MVSIMTDKSKIIDELFAAGAHFGYSKSKRHPSTQENILGMKDSVDIINLEKTVSEIETAKERLHEIFAKNKKVILVGNKVVIKDLVPELASCEKVDYVANRWIGGTLTNFAEIKKRITKLKRLISESERGEFSKYTKKEALQKEKEILKLKKYYFGLINMIEIPQALVVVDSADEAIAIKEAQDMGVDVIAISSTDNDISGIKYPIVANDRSRKTAEIIIKELLSDCK